jgi:sortase (surface protein transpeptidase)
MYLKVTQTLFSNIVFQTYHCIQGGDYTVKKPQQQQQQQQQKEEKTNKQSKQNKQKPHTHHSKTLKIQSEKEKHFGIISIYKNNCLSLFHSLNYKRCGTWRSGQRGALAC